MNPIFPFELGLGVIIDSDTTPDGKQVILTIGDSTSIGVNDNTGTGPAPAAGTAYYYRRATTDIVPMTLDVVPAPAGTQYPTFCTDYYNGSGKKAVIIPTGVGGSSFAPHVGDISLTNDWTLTGDCYAPAIADARNALRILKITKLKAIFLSSLGVNDARHDTDLTIIQSAITDLISRLQTEFPGTPILIEQIGRHESGGVTPRIFTIRGYLRTLCENNSGCYIINGMLSMTAAGGASADNIHPSQTGNIMRGGMLARWMLNSTYSKWARSIIASQFDNPTTAHKNLISTLLGGVNLSDFLEHDTIIIAKTTIENNTFLDWGFLTSPTKTNSTFIPNDSILADGTATYFRTGLLRDRSTIKGTQNDGFLAIKIKVNNSTAAPSSVAPVCVSDTVSIAAGIQQLPPGTGIAYRFNDFTLTTYTGETILANNSEYLAGRNSVTNKFLYKNGVQVHTASVTSTGLCAIQEYIGANNSNNTNIQFMNMNFEYYRTGRFTTVNQLRFKQALDAFLAAW